VDLEHERRLAALLRELVAGGLVSAAHDVADGGLAVALAEACFERRLGARLRLPLTPRALFSESQGRAFVTAAATDVEELLAAAERHGVRALEVGEVGGGDLRIEADGERAVVAVDRLRSAWATALPRALGL
jgi:phosphoribosylformylglycinamidine synthase